MRRVAAAAGVTPMAIYHHFANREALLAAVTMREFDRLAEELDTRRIGGSAKRQLSTLVNWYVDYALRSPHTFDYVFLHPRQDVRQYPADFRRRSSPTLNRLADIVEAGMERGELRKGDVWEVAMAIWAHVHGYVALYRGGRFSLSEEAFRRLCRRSMGRLFDGLKG